MTIEPAPAPEPTGLNEAGLLPHEVANAEQLSAIEAIAKDWVPEPDPYAEPAEGAPQEAAAAPAEDAPPPAAEAAPAAEEPAEAPPPAPGADDRSLARLVEREVALRGREEALSAKEKHLAGLEAELGELREKSQSYTGDFQQSLRLRPTEALRAAGHDPEHLVRLILAEKMVAEGKPVDPQLQRLLDRADYDYKYQELNRRQEEFQRQQAAQQFVAGIELGARTYISGEISKNAPTVAAVAKNNPDAVYRAIMDEIAQDAASRAGKDISATVLTYEEAALRVEKRFSYLKSLFVAPSEGASPPAASTPAPAGTTKQSTPVEKKGSSATAPRPLVAKKHPTSDELMEEGIRAGVLEHRRLESAKRPPA